MISARKITVDGVDVVLRGNKRLMNVSLELEIINKS